MSIFQKIRSSRQEVSYKKNFLKLKLLQNSLKNIRDVFFNLKKFQAKGLQLYRKETRVYALS